MFIVTIYGVNTNLGDGRVQEWQEWGNFAVNVDNIDDDVVKNILTDHGLEFGRVSSYGFRPTHYKSHKIQDFYMRID